MSGGCQSWCRCDMDECWRRRSPFIAPSAALMASDLATTPISGLTVQASGDAHLSNFGGYATPERTLVFDLNDFDETLPGPWEWDVKRLAASVVLAGRANGFRAADCAGAARAAVRSYRERMAEFAPMSHLAVWYTRIAAAEVAADLPKAARKKWERAAKKATKSRPSPVARKDDDPGRRQAPDHRRSAADRSPQRRSGRRPVADVRQDLSLLVARRRQRAPTSLHLRRLRPEGRRRRQRRNSLLCRADAWK